MNYDLDIDIDEINKIKNPQIKNLVHQLKSTGIAYTSDNKLGQRISRKYPELRKPGTPILIIGRDETMNKHFIGLNFPELQMTGMKELDKSIKKIIRSFGGKP